MSRIRAKDTNPERIVRSIVHRLGFRFSLHRRELPGTPDVVLRRHKAVIDVRGCFWHGHTCKRLPNSRREYWEAKIAANRARDLRNAAELAGAGWRVLVVWECETKKLDNLQKKIARFFETED